MLVDIIIDDETVLTINMKSIDFLLRTRETVDFPVKMDDRTVIIKFRKERGD